MYEIRHIFYLGTGLNVFCVASMLLLVFHPVLARSILVKGMELLEKMHLMRHKSTRIEKLNASMDQYHTTAVYLKDHMMVLVNVFAITLFQRFALFTATWFVYKAFGLSGTNAFVIILLQSVISVSVDMLPLPGGMGISEKLFSMILNQFWKHTFDSGNDLKQRTWILYRITDQCNFYDRGEFYNRKKLKEESINNWRVILKRIKQGGNKMLGVYDYTVILTYISLWISIGGMMLSLNGHLDLAVLCLALSGLCDMFDGKIARTKKDRTEIEKRFGIRLIPCVTLSVLELDRRSSVIVWE